MFESLSVQRPCASHPPTAHETALDAADLPDRWLQRDRDLRRAGAGAADAIRVVPALGLCDVWGLRCPGMPNGRVFV